MGKKEHLEELDKQLEEAKKKRKIGSIGIFSGILLCFVFLPLGLVILALAIFYIVNSNNKINQVNLEKAKLK